MPRCQVLVCTNERPADANRPCCARRGGLALYRRFKDAVRNRGLRDQVLVTRTGCLRHCSHGTVVAAWPENLWLGSVTAEDVEGILERLIHGSAQGRTGASAAKDDPIVDRRLVDVPWE